MPKLYAKPTQKKNILKPKTETINFLLDYSKSLHIMKLKTMHIEVLQN